MGWPPTPPPTSRRYLRGEECRHQHVGNVDELADLEVDGDAADRVGLLPCPASFREVLDHVEERVAGGEGRVLGVVLAVLGFEMPVVA